MFHDQYLWRIDSEMTRTCGLLSVKWDRQRNVRLQKTFLGNESIKPGSGCAYVEQLNSLEMLHRKAARVQLRVIILLAPWHGYSAVCWYSKWNTLTYYCKLRIINYFIAYFNHVPHCAYLTNKPRMAYNFRRSNNITVPRFNLYSLKNSISYKGAILWNAISTYFTGEFTDCYWKVKKDF